MLTSILQGFQEKCITLQDLQRILQDLREERVFSQPGKDQPDEITLPNESMHMSQTSYSLTVYYINKFGMDYS